MNDQKKEAYHAKIEAELEKVKAELRRLEAGIEKKKADEELKDAGKLDVVRSRHERLQERLEDLRCTSGAAWSKAKDGVSSAWAELEKALDAARKEFKK